MNKTLLLNRVIFLLSLVGVGVASYLLYSYLNHTPLLCLNKGCEVVRQSEYSALFGIPVPAIGLLGFSVIALVTMIRTFLKKTVLDIGLLLISFIGFLFVSWFTYVEIFLIKAICSWCVVTAILMTIIFILAIRSHFLQKAYEHTK